MILQTIIVDDEQGSRETLGLLLREYCPDVQVVAMADSVTSGLAAIRQYQPQLLFLDIRMPFGNGFELLEYLNERQFEVILTTAYDQYAVRAIRSGVLDYLLKPIDADELLQAVQRAREKYAVFLQQKSQPASGYPYELAREKIEVLLQTLSATSLPEKIALPTASGMEFIRIQTIIRCEAVANYTRFYFLNHEPLLITRTLKEFDRMFTYSNFFRVHNSHLINLDHVVRYLRSDGGQLVMVDGGVVEISRRRRDELLERLGGTSGKIV